ncbi:MAG: hypothetical protein M5R41_13250 [Bacteroidia bacterium]|nr:hypothetical protein [Bacteroidia bacterium]
MTIENEHMDVLQNLEAAIVMLYRQNADLLDYDVDEAFDVLIHEYRLEQGGRPPKQHKMSPKAALVYNVLRPVCEWRLGRSADTIALVLSIDTLLLCLKRLKLSLERWNGEGGRQGYLRFINRFVP